MGQMLLSPLATLPHVAHLPPLSRRFVLERHIPRHQAIPPTVKKVGDHRCAAERLASQL